MADKISEVKTIRVSAKCSDMCWLGFNFADGTEYFSKDGYVPEWLSPDGAGDYVEMEIDRDTGQILNWKRPSDKALRGRE